LRLRGGVGAGAGCPVVGMGLIFEIVFGRGRAGRRVTEALEFVEGPVEGALDAGFVARKGFNRAGAGGVVGEGAGPGVEGVVVVGELRHADGEQAGFEGAEAAEAPGGHGHLLDEQGFGGAGGVVFVEESVAKFLEFLRIFVGQDGGLGGESVTESVELTLGKHRFDSCGGSRPRITGECQLTCGERADVIEEAGEKWGGRW
jgi:hypothetical protein